MEQPDPSLVERYVQLAVTDGEPAVARIAALGGAGYATARAAAVAALRMYRELSEAERTARRAALPAAPRRRWRWRIGELAGFPVHVHVSIVVWLLIPLEAGADGRIGEGLFSVAALLVIIVAHELAHALACRLLGLGTGSMTVWAFGGYFIPLEIDVLPFHLERSRRLRYALLCLAGPMANLALAAVGALVAAATGAAAASEFVYLNLGVAGINLLPVPGLDGGGVLVALGSLVVGWRAVVRGLALLSLGIAAAIFWWPPAFTSLGQATIGILVVGGVSAFASTFHSDERLLARDRKLLEDERRFVLGTRT